MQRLARWILWTAVVLLVVLLLAAGVEGWITMHAPLNADAAPRAFRVEAGQSLSEVRRALVTHGLISPRAPLVVWGRLTGADRRIQPGAYELSPSQTPREILANLVAGRRILARVTIPEGWRLERILSLLATTLDASEESLRAAATDTAWLRARGLPVPSLEGYLHPETYRLEPGAAPRRVLNVLIEAGKRLQTDARRARAESLGWSWHEVLTLASIIESETADAGERARISAVYHNRLAHGALLQADPTVAYGLQKPAAQLTSEDLAAGSPYNTYVHPGLPPGPICSPGEPSIDAALWPLEDCEDLYFVARGDGTHLFSRTLEEHNRARRELREAARR